MIAGLTKGDKAAEAGDQFEKHFCIGPTSLNREVYYSTLIYHTLKELYSQLGDISYANKTRSEKEIIDFYVLPQFAHFKEILDEGIKKDPLFANSAIVKFCYSIIKDNKLFKELEEMNIPAKNSSVKARISFQLKNLKEKVWFLRELKEKKNFTYVQGAFGDGWSFYDLINDRDFKQTYIDKAVTESANKSFKEDIDKCIELAEQGKKTASKYFERKDVELQAYYTETDNAHRVLNVNLINYNRSEPTRISDILQQEKDIKELNIYCNKKHEIYAYQEDKKRHYEFKEDACYEMTSTWPVKDEFGNVSICTMIMNVSSDRITEVLKFNGEDFVSSEEILELIKQNDELYIQGLSLYNAVMKSLEKGKAADVVPINFHNESIVAYQNKEPEEKLDHKVDADNSLPPSPSINSNASTQTKVKLQQIATQTEVASQRIETQTEVNLQQIATQTEINSQQMDELILNNQILSEENVELKQEMSNLKKEAVELKKEKSDLEDKFDHLEHLNKKMDGNQEQLSEQVLDLQKELSCSEKVTQELINKLKSAEAEKKEVNQKLVEAGQRIEALKKQTSDSQDKLEKKERGSKIEINEIRKELTQLKENLERNEEELKSVYEEKRKLEDKLKGVNTEKKESEDKLKEFEKEIDQAAHIMKEKEQSISNLKYQMLGLKNEYKAQLKSMDREHEDEVKELKENRDALSDIIAGKVLDIEGLMKKLQSSEKEKEFFRGQVEELSEETFADKQKGFNNQFYTLTGDISSEPDNVPRKKIELSRSLSFDSESDNESYVPQNPQKKKKKLLRFSSFDSEFNKSYVPQEGDNDSAYDSNEENCDNHPCSSVLVLGSVSPIRAQARSRSVDR